MTTDEHSGAKPEAPEAPAGDAVATATNDASQSISGSNPAISGSNPAIPAGTPTDTASAPSQDVTPPAAPAAEVPAPAAEVSAPAEPPAESGTEAAAAPAAEAPAAAPVAPAAEAPVVAVEAQAASSSDAAPAATSDAPHEGPEPSHAAAEGEGDDAPSEAASGDGSSEGGEATAGDGEAPKKKRRRRRRKKKKAPGEEGVEAAAPSASGETAGDGNASAEGKPEGKAAKAKRKPKPMDKPAFNVGDEVFGRVSNVTRHALWIDVAGGKAQGLFDRDQLIAVPPGVGEQFIAKVKSFSVRGGMLMLGPEAFDVNLAKAELRAALQSEQPIDCWVTGVIKGGLEVDYKGVRAFAPASHVDMKPSSDLSHLLGEKLEFVVTHYAKKGRDVVVSRKQMIEAEYKEKRAEQLKNIQPDAEEKAIVRTVLQWGVFATLPEHGDVEGVIHMNEASHDRGARLESLFKVGQEIPVKVLRVDDKGKLWLSHKATQTDPWAEAPEKYKAGSQHQGKVVRLTDFGAFVQLEPGIDGLCHVADLAFQQVEHPKDVVSEGQDFAVVVAHLDVKNRKVTLHPMPPEAEIPMMRTGRIAQYATVEVEVMAHREAGLGVRILGATGRHARGFIPAGQSGTPRGTDLRKTFPLGTRLSVKVIDVDRRGGEARLSIRALKDDAEKQAYREYRKKVQRESSFGTFGDLLKDKLG